jgi:propionyl-CoA carboxylase beta chain
MNAPSSQPGAHVAQIEAQHARGKLTARERIELLLDPGSFEEFLSAEHAADPSSPGDGVIAGRGAVNGRAVYVYAKDFTVRDGALNEAHAQKIARTQDMALSARAPIVGLIDSGGARLEAGVAALAGYGEIFQRHIRASGIIPQISLIMGPCAGADAFCPALTDFLFMVENTSHLFVAGPDIVRTITNEAIAADELGGARVHTAKTGLCDRAYANDFEALMQMRRLIDFLPASNTDGVPEWPSFDDVEREDPSLDTLIPENPLKAYDMKELIEKTVDEGDFFEIGEAHARNIVTGFGRIDGRTVGVVANQPLVLAGVLDADAARKAARFVRFCDCFGVPIVTFVDAPGFLPGLAQEHGGLVREVAKLIFAYGEARAPKVTLVTRNAFGGAYSVMGSKHLGRDVNFAANFAWPTARIALIGAGAGEDDGASPHAAAARGYIDAVIEPRATRNRIARALAALRRKELGSPGKMHDNIPL